MPRPWLSRVTPTVLRVAGVLVAALLAIVLWTGGVYRAGTTPIIVDATLSPGATLEVSLPDAWQMPLVQSQDGLWISELPPRRDYEPKLTAQGGAATLHSAELLGLQKRPPRSLYKWQPQGGAQILQPGDSIPIGSYQSRSAYGRAFVSGFSLMLMLLGGLLALWRLGTARTEESCGEGLRPVHGLIILGLSLAHLILNTTATPLFWPADSIGYGTKALLLYNEGRFYEGGLYYELTRLPGAPLMEATAWRLFGLSLESVVILQDMLYVSAAVFALHAMARRTGPWAAVFAAIFVFLSPPGLYFSRLFASEGPFAIYALFSCAAMLRAWTAGSTRTRWAWSTVAAAGVAMAVLTRLNGLVLLGLPLVILAAYGVAGLRTRSVRPLKSALPWTLPVIALSLALGAWTLRNYRLHDFPAPTDMAGLSAAEAQFKSGTLDIAAADDPELYRAIATARRASNYGFEAWSLSALYQERIAAEGPVDKAASHRLDSMMAAFSERSEADLAPSIRAATFLRLLGWGLYLDADPHFQPFGNPWSGYDTFTQDQLDYTNEILRDWIHPALEVTQHPIGPPQQALNAFQPHYQTLRQWAVLLGLVGLVIAGWRRDGAALVFLLPYYGNILLNAWLGVALGRYIQVLDPLLWIGLTLASAPAIRQLTLRACAPAPVNTPSAPCEPRN